MFQSPHFYQVRLRGTVSGNAALSAISALSPADGKMIYFTGASAAALVDSQAFGRSLLNAGDAGDVFGALGLGAMALEPNVTTGVIAANAVTNAKLAQMAESRLKGRASGTGTGDPTDLTPAQVAAILALAKNAVTDFGAVGDDATNNDAAMTAAVNWVNATGGIVYWPPGLYRYDTPAPTITSKGGGFVGERGWTNLGGTCFRFNAATGNFLTLAAASGFALRDIRFMPVPYRTSGAEIRLHGGCQSILIERCNFSFACMPIDIGDATWTTIRDCVSLYNTGIAHVRTNGEGTGTQVVDGVVIDNLITGSGENPSWNTIKGNWATGTAYSLGDFVIANGSIWKCTQAGTSAGAGTGPNAATAGYANSEAPFVVDITDNTAKWRFQCDQSAAGVLIDSYSLYVKIQHSDFNSGVWGVLITDSVGSSSEPKHISLIGTFIDHVYEDCVRLAAGQGVFIAQPLFSAAAEGRGVYAPNSGTFKGELLIEGGQIYSNAAEGVWIEKASAAHIRILGTAIGGNSLKTSNTYDAIKFASGVEHFQVIGAKARPMLETFGTQRYGIDVGESCQHFVLWGNDVQGNGTGGINDASTTTANKRIGANVGDPLNQVAITVGGSPFTWTNPTGKPVQVTVAGGTVSAISVNGIAVAAATNQQVVLWVGGNMTVTYSSAPTMNYIPLV